MKPDIVCRTCEGKGYTIIKKVPAINTAQTCDQCDGSGISVRYNPYESK